MKVITFILFLTYFIGIYTTTNFEEVLTDLKNLEKYIREYMKEKNPQYTLTHLIACYIRLGGYTGMSWAIAGGVIPNDLSQYIIDKDSAEGTNAHACQTYREIELPNNEKLDFVHFFAVMNGIEVGNAYDKNFAHLVGWGGDTFQLLQDIKTQKGEIEELMTIAKTFFNIKGGFDAADLVSDLDAPIILKKKNDNNDFADLIREYYNSDQYLKRVNNFVKLTFPTLKKKEKFREVLYDIYDKDDYINVLECQDGMREGISCYFAGELKPEYANNQKAAVYVVSDYLAENYIPEKEINEINETETESGYTIFSFNLHFIFIISLFIFIL